MSSANRPSPPCRQGSSTLVSDVLLLRTWPSAAANGCGKTKLKNLLWWGIVAAVLLLLLRSVWDREAPRSSKSISSPLVVANRTAEAENQRVAIFYRVPKTGSEMMQEMGKVLAKLKNYRAFVDPYPAVYFPTDDSNQQFMENFKSEILDTIGDTGEAVYYRHMGYFNFSAHGAASPVMVGMVRHPVDRVISWYQYIRWHDRPDDRMPTVCNSTAKWRGFCDGMLDYRRKEKQLHDPELDFDACYRGGRAECVFRQGHGGPDDWLVTAVGGQRLHLARRAIFEDYRSQVFFFCDDNGPDCLAFNSESALRRAKANAESSFAVVGVLERLDDTLEALEAFLPRFFGGITSLYRYNSNNKGKIIHTNKNPFKKPISADIRAELEQHFDKEIEFYEFCRQRLWRQVQHLRSEQSAASDSATGSSNKDSLDFDYEDMEPYREEFEAEDYVLLV